MSEAKHTQGPWHLMLSDNGTPHIVHTGGHDFTDLDDLTSRICVMPAEITMSFNSLANARLITAAPDMLAALEEMVAKYVGLVESGDAGFWDAEADPEVIAARAAIAKARSSHE